MGPAQSCLDMHEWSVFGCLYAPTIQQAAAAQVRSLRSQLRRMQRQQHEYELRDRTACREIERLATGGSAFAAREKAKARRPVHALLSARARRNYTLCASTTCGCASARETWCN